MAELDPLIRVRKHAVDERQKALADLYRQVDTMHQRIQSLRESLLHEQAIAQDIGSVDVFVDLSRFTQATHIKIAKGLKDIGKLETRIDIAREDMRSAFAELRKLEIVKRHRLQSAQTKAQRKETQTLDETAIESYLRSTQEGREEA